MVIAEQVAAGLIREVAAGRDERVVSVLLAAARWVEAMGQVTGWDPMRGVEVRGDGRA